MASIVINSKNQEEHRFLTNLLNKLGLDIHTLSDEETEDLGLAILMKSSDKNDVIDGKTVKNQLRKK